MAETLPVEVINQIRHNLTDFGYGGLTHEYVAEQCNAIMRGDDPPNIIAMFARDMLMKAGYLKE